MEVFLLTLGVMLLVVAAMSVGVMAGRKPIQGSCGGIGALGLGQVCEICGGDPQRCDAPAPAESTGAAPGFYDATRR